MGVNEKSICVSTYKHFKKFSQYTRWRRIILYGAEYTSLRLAELVTKESASHFNFLSLCDMHRYIFQDVYEWAGEIRVINIEKNVTNILDDMNKFFMEGIVCCRSFQNIFRVFSKTLACTSISRRKYTYNHNILQSIYWK